MPDWSYHPLLKPLSAWLSTDARRSLALRGLRAIGGAPGGAPLIEFLGHMQPDICLETPVLRRHYASPIGLGSGVDPDGLAVSALGRFGVGFIELGPYILSGAPGIDLVRPPLACGVRPSAIGQRLCRRPAGVKIWMRVALIADEPQAVLGVERLLDGLEGIDALSITTWGARVRPVSSDAQLWKSLITVARQHDIAAVLVDLPLDCPVSGAATALEAGAHGIVLRPAIERAPDVDAVARIRTVRQTYPHAGAVIAACGADSPCQILEQLDSGADLIAIDSGFIHAGPGLAKRGNEALAAVRCDARRTPPVRAVQSGWCWATLLGLGMVIAGAVVWWVGLTSVVLPYDLAFLGLSREALAGLNPELLGFMKHDRITLAGTLLSIGVLYFSLAWNGMRAGWSWSRHAVMASGVVGFASLFLFLGFHYVDPLHVALSAALFPLFLLGMTLPTRRRVHPSHDLDNDSAWYLGLTGQLFFIGLGVALVVAGLTITLLGVTHVFVFSDLQFLKTTATDLNSANAHLLPLIAHDRAGFGGALASDGIAVLLLSVWGFRRGERWVWWTLLVAGLVGLISAVYAHAAVGYLEFGHLFPVFVSAVVFVVGLLFGGPHLLTRAPARLSSS